MSRASNLRDTIRDEVAKDTELPVVSVVVPSFSPEELKAGPRVAVKAVRRQLEVAMGPDLRQVDISVALFGLSAEASGFDITKDGYREQEVELCDSYDTTMEELIGLFVPGGRLSRAYLAGHRIDDITQETLFDLPHYYENGIYVSAFTVTYVDTLDE